jgi:allantoinase
VAGWEFMGHAYEQMPIHKVDDQKSMIERSMDTLEKFTGKPLVTLPTQLKTTISL